MPANARKDLAAQQTRLVEALVAGASPPEGFDPAQVQIAARALAAKRSRSVTKAWPLLAEALGEHFREIFAGYANQSPQPPGAAPQDDGRAFAQWLARRGLLPNQGRMERAADGVERGFPVRLVLQRKPYRLAVVWRRPRGGVGVLGGARR